MKKFLCIIQFIGLFLILALVLPQGITANDALTITYDSNSHTIAFPFEKSFRMTTKVKNNSATEVQVSINLPQEQAEGQNPNQNQFTILTPTGFYRLDAGEEIEIVSVFEALMSQDKTPISLQTSLEFDWGTGSKTIPISVDTTYLETEGKNNCNTIFRVFDKETKEQIKNIGASAMLQSALSSEESISDNGEVVLRTLCKDYLEQITAQYSVDHKYPGYLLQVTAPGYKGFFDPNFLPEDGQTKEIWLDRLYKVGDYQKTVEIETGFSIWWIKASQNEEYFAFSQGTHGGPGIESPSTTKVTFTDKEGSVLWQNETAGECWGLDVSAEGNYVAAACHNGSVYVWDKTGELVWEKNNAGRKTRGMQIRWVKFSPDEKYLLSGPTGEVVENASLCEVSSGNEIWSYYVDGFVREARFSTDGQTVYVASSSGTLFALNITDGSLKYTAAGGFYIPFLLGFSDDQNLLISAGKGRAFVAVDLNTGVLKWKTPVDQTVTAGEVAEDGSVVGSTVGGMTYGLDADGEITWWRNYKGVGHNGTYLTNNGQYAILGGSNPTLLDKDGNVLWQREKTMEIKEMTGPSSINTGAAYDTWISESGDLIILGGDDGKVQFYKGEIKNGRNDYNQLIGLNGGVQVNNENSIENRSNLAIILIIAAAVLVAVAVVVVIICKKKKIDIKKLIKKSNKIENEPKIE